MTLLHVSALTTVFMEAVIKGKRKNGKLY